MGTIARPNKPTGGGGGSSWVPGVDLLANELNEDIDPIYNDYNGNIADVNIAASAAIVGTKIAVAPAGIPTNRINDLAVTEPKIENFAVALGKLKKTTYSHVAIITDTVAAGFNAAAQIDTGLSTATTLPIAVYLNAPATGIVTFSLYQSAGTWRLNIICSSNTFTIGANVLKVDYLT